MPRLHKAVVRTIADVDAVLAEMVDSGQVVPRVVDELLDTRLRLMEMA